MPLPLIAAGIAAGANLLGGHFGRKATREENAKSRAFSREMYGLQKQDNLEFWRMQNEYNSPEKQIERLRAANLNPSLMYGGGTSAAAGQADKIATPDVQAAQFRVPEFGDIGAAGNMIGNYFDTKIKQAQYSNLKAQNSVLYSDAALKLAQGSNTQFDYEFKRKMEDVQADYLRESLREKETDIDIKISQEERNAAMHSKNLEEAAQRIMKLRLENSRDPLERQRMKSVINNLDKDSGLKELDMELWSRGITRQDPLWARMLVRYLETAIEKGGFNIWRGMFNR